MRSTGRKEKLTRVQQRHVVAPDHRIRQCTATESASWDKQFGNRIQINFNMIEVVDVMCTFGIFFSSRRLFLSCTYANNSTPRNFMR